MKEEDPESRVPLRVSLVCHVLLNHIEGIPFWTSARMGKNDIVALAQQRLVYGSDGRRRGCDSIFTSEEFAANARFKGYH